MEISGKQIVLNMESHLSLIDIINSEYLFNNHLYSQEGKFPN